MLQGILALSLWFWYDGPWAQLFVKYVSNGTCPFNIIITDNWEDQQFMKLQRLLSLVRKAVDDYQMISAGDRIAIGISGGKDSSLSMSSNVFTRSHSSSVHLLWTLVLESRILMPYRPSAMIFPSPIQLFPRTSQKSFSRPAENLIHALCAQRCGKAP